MSKNNIWVAAADNEVQIVKDLIESGKFTPNSKDDNGYTPIHAAVSYGHLELIEFLLKTGDVNIKDSEGDTPLHHVESVQVAKLLIDNYKADYKIKNNDGLTAGEYIAEEGDFEDVAQYLQSLIHDGPTVTETETNIPEINGHQIKYTLQDETPLDEEAQARKDKIEAILNSENPEEEMRKLVEQAVTDGWNEYNDSGHEVKKSRND